MYSMCFNAINGSGPAYLSELLHVYTPSRALCSSSDTRMLKIQQYKRKTHGFHAFSCFGPHKWNSLPQDLRHCSALSSFKSKLKTFLFSQYFSSQLISVPSLCYSRVCSVCFNVCVCVCVDLSCIMCLDVWISVASCVLTCGSQLHHVS